MAATEVISVDAASVTVLSEVDGIFTSKKECKRIHSINLRDLGNIPSDVPAIVFFMFCLNVKDKWTA